MNEQRWWRRALALLNREYERRIRRASQVGEYNAHPSPPDDEEGAAVIVNLPRGARLRRPESPPGDLPPSRPAHE